MLVAMGCKPLYVVLVEGRSRTIISSSCRRHGMMVAMDDRSWARRAVGTQYWLGLRLGVPFLNQVRR